jgi:glutathione S-transferase
LGAFGAYYYLSRLQLIPLERGQNPADGFREGAAPDAKSPGWTVDSAGPKELARILDDHLAGRRWMIADHLCYADFRTATALPFAAGAKLPLAGYRNIQAWNDRLNTLPGREQPFVGLD